MSWAPAMPPALAATAGGRIKMKKRAGLPKLLHKLFIKVLRLRSPEETMMRAAFEACYGGYRMGSSAADEEEYCYCYGYGGGASWAGVLSSIPEEEVEEGTPDVAVLRAAKSSEQSFVVGPPEAATVVHVEVLL